MNTMMDKTKSLNLLLLALIILLCACSSKSAEEYVNNSTSNYSEFDFTQQTELTLPPGFKAVVVAEGLGPIRHITVADNGDIFLSLQSMTNGHGAVALRDTNGDGKANVIKYFGNHADTGIQIWGDYLYAASTETIYRYEMSENSLVPQGEPEILVKGFPEQNQHSSKAFVINDEGELFVNVGAPSNSCQKQDRTQGSPGMVPCPLLKKHAGIWNFSATELGQTFSPDDRYASGLRNIVAIDWYDQTEALYVVQHGRDQLYQNWPMYYTKEESARLPAEAMYKVNQDDQFSWPYGYYNHMKDRLILAPEYGGNGKIQISESKYAGEFEEPIIAFPGHWAPNALLFYQAEQFPEKYQNGAFIAFHGSWNRAPLPQQGYKVVYVPFENGGPTGTYQDFATGFAGDPSPQPGKANHRPTGLAVGPDGSLYISDDKGGTLWRIMYVGQ